MRTAACSFLFLATVSLTQAQISSIGSGQTSCEHFPARQQLLLNNVRPALELAMHGGKVMFGGGIVYADTSAERDIQMLGDGTSVGVLKTVSPKDLTNPEFVKAYLQVIRTAFSEPKWTVCAEDKTPEVTLFLLDYLREKVADEELQRQIDSTKEYVLKQAGPTRQSPFPDPSQSAK